MAATCGAGAVPAEAGAPDPGRRLERSGHRRRGCEGSQNRAGPRRHMSAVGDDLAPDALRFSVRSRGARAPGSHGVSGMVGCPVAVVAGRHASWPPATPDGPAVRNLRAAPDAPGHGRTATLWSCRRRLVVSGKDGLAALQRKKIPPRTPTYGRYCHPMYQQLSTPLSAPLAAP